MTAFVYVVTRAHEGRRTDTEIAWTSQGAKERARNLMVLTEPPEWTAVEDGREWVFTPPDHPDTEYRIVKKPLYGFPDE